MENTTAKTQTTRDEHGRTVVKLTGTSRVAVITTNGSGFHFVPTVNHGETVVHGGRMFRTMRGALRAADRFVIAGLQ